MSVSMYGLEWRESYQCSTLFCWSDLLLALWRSLHQNVCCSINYSTSPIYAKVITDCAEIWNSFWLKCCLWGMCTIDLNTQNQHEWVHNLAFLVEHLLNFLRNYATVPWRTIKYLYISSFLNKYISYDFVVDLYWSFLCLHMNFSRQTPPGLSIKLKTSL